MVEVVNEYDVSEAEEIVGSGMNSEIKGYVPPTTNSSVTSGQKFALESLKDNMNAYEGISITTAIFMVILIAISTILMLCCCKAYLLCCKRRRSLTRRIEEEDGRCSRRSFHHSLPVRCRHTDEPPCYEDVLSGRVATTKAPDCRESIAESSLTQFKESSVSTKWKNQENATDPPMYSSVTDGSQQSNCDDVQPPSYYAISLAPYCGSDMTNSAAGKSSKSVDLIRKSLNTAFQTVSALVFSRKTSSESNSDPTLEITCDGNVMRDDFRTTTSNSELSSAESVPS